ncbi:hypothetical protein [Rhizobium hidalgonense]|uniref:hypothetical protein n=1 Tax=Rhizobium hidalgonense TaxID=1538159 RepID=UPI002871DA97|nr:hypothetical protein [Rhizobium hidalgonense]MDR9805537.1 hypothetical protein [Rhizobium hidalgonense]
MKSKLTRLPDSLPGNALVLGVILLAGGLPCSMTHAVAEPDRSKALPQLNDLVITDSLNIARAERPSSGLWITCSGGSQIRLLLITRLPIEEEFAGNGTRSEGRAELRVLPDGIRTVEAIKRAPRLNFRQATWRRDDENDIVLMPPQSIEEVQILSRAFLPAPPAVVRVDIAETGTEMGGTVDGQAIMAFNKNCLAKK